MHVIFRITVACIGQASHINTCGMAGQRLIVPLREWLFILIEYIKCKVCKPEGHIYLYICANQMTTLRIKHTVNAQMQPLHVCQLINQKC